MKRFYLMTALLLTAFFVQVERVWASEISMIRPLGFEIEKDGSVLVTDGGDWSDQGGKVIRFSEKGEVLWVYEKDLKFPHSAIRLLNGNILIADTGNDRLVEIDDQTVVWSSIGVIDLDYPNKVVETANGNWLVTDRNNDRVVELNRKNILRFWDGLNRPHGATQSDNGNVLVCDSESNSVKVLDKDSKFIEEFSSGLNWPRSAQKLENGNVLISDSRNNRVIEIDKDGKLVWEFKDVYWPYQSERLENGLTVISDSQNRRLIWVDSEKKTVREIRLNIGEDQFGVWRIGSQLSENQGKWNRIDDVLVAENYGRGEAFWYQRLVAPREGEAWKFSAEVKTELTGDVNHGARLEIWVETEKGGYAAEPFVSKWLSGEKTEKLTAEIKIPPEAKTVELRGMNNGKGKIWISEVRWQKSDWWTGWGIFVALGALAAVVLRLVANKFL